MLKKFLLTLILILAGLSAFATDNFLNSVVIDNVDGEKSGGTGPAASGCR